jgi:ankyrin repeat protein
MLWAVFVRKIEAVKALASLGANINTPKDDGRTLLMRTMWSNDRSRGAGCDSFRENCAAKQQHNSVKPKVERLHLRSNSQIQTTCHNSHRHARNDQHPLP